MRYAKCADENSRDISEEGAVAENDKTISSLRVLHQNFQRLEG